MTGKKYFGNNGTSGGYVESSTTVPNKTTTYVQNSAGLNPKLVEALGKLEKVNNELQDLVNEVGGINTTYTIAYAKGFVKAKTEFQEGGKAPSDEVAKQMVLSSPEMESILGMYHTYKAKIELYLEMSRNIRKQIDALKGTMFEDAAVNNIY